MIYEDVEKIHIRRVLNTVKENMCDDYNQSYIYLITRQFL